MSQPLTPAVNLTPLTSTAQTDAVLVNTTDSNSSSSDNPAPSLHTTQTPTSPLAIADTAAGVDTSAHTAPVARTQTSENSSRTSSTSAANELAALKEAALSGDASAQYELGKRYGFGDGVAQNDKEAANWIPSPPTGFVWPLSEETVVLNSTWV